MVKRPKEPFYNSSHNTKPDKSQLQSLDDLNPARDKDNTGRAPKPPTHVPGGSASNLAARGALGTKRGLAGPIVPARPMSVNVKKDEVDKDLSVDGKIHSMDGYSFTAKVNDLPSRLGIGGGKIAKLEIIDGERVAARFDRGWDIPPRTARDFKPIASKTHDKDHGRDR